MRKDNGYLTRQDEIDEGLVLSQTAEEFEVQQLITYHYEHIILPPNYRKMSLEQMEQYIDNNIENWFEMEKPLETTDLFE